MRYINILKKIIILLNLSLLLFTISCKEKMDLSTIGNNIVCYSTTYNKGVYKSDNGGISWYPLLEDQEDIYLYSKKLFIGPDSKRLYITTTGGGLFFIDIEKGILNRVDEFKDEDVRSMVFRKVSDGQGTGLEIFVAKKETGIYKTVSGADSWEPFNNGLTYRDVNVLYNNKGKLFAGTIKGIFRWDDASGMWQDISKSIMNNNIISIGANPEGRIIYAGTGVYQYSKGRFQSIPSLYKSTDNGSTWEPSDKGLPDGVLVFSITVNPLKPERIYLGTSEGIYRSTDSGMKWSKTDDALPEKLLILDIDITRISDNKDLVYAAGAYGLFMAVDDKNQEWTSRSYGLDKTYISSILLQNE